jgi:transcription initiation factor TFIIIB Brf1 subunit/transcription initiation factor TFIIB
MAMSIKLSTEDAVLIGRTLYVKREEALESVLATLREVGYELKDGREREEHPVDNWYASLDVRRGKCGTCNAHISTTEIEVHGHVCEQCGAVTYREFVDGKTTIRFYFRDERGSSMRTVRMTVAKYDPDGGWLYLKPGFLQRGFGVMTGKRAREYFHRHRDKWEGVEEGDTELFKIRYPSPGLITEECVIEPCEIWGSERNHSIVRVWEGKEYGEHSRDFPIPDGITVEEAWRWAPLEPTPELHRTVIRAGGLTPDQGYYYQDGRREVEPEQYVMMGLFIEHLTTLDGAAFLERCKRFRLDGPGMVEDVAAFCHPESNIQNEPNFANTLVALGQALDGDDVHPDQAIAAHEGLGDPAAKEFARGMRSR